MELFGFQRIVSIDPQLERCADDICAASRGHDFLAGRHKRRAHDAGLFKAAAAAVALLKIADERAVLEREREHRLEWKLERACEILAQMIIDLGRDAAARRPYQDRRSEEHTSELQSHSDLVCRL